MRRTGGANAQANPFQACQSVSLQQLLKPALLHQQLPLYLLRLMSSWYQDAHAALRPVGGADSDSDSD